MKYTSKQMGNSRNTALLRRAARLGCGISMVAVSAMLAARPAKAQDAASIISSSAPPDSSSAGFVTSGSDQLNIGNAIIAEVNDAVGSSTVDNTGTGLLPSTATVTGNKLAAYATGSGQTNTVDFATIGTGEDLTGIAVLADQANLYLYSNDDEYTPETINAAVTNSALSNTTTNAVDGDTLTNSSNLITAQVAGNVASSSVIGVVPIDYDAPEPGGVSTDTISAAASGNVVVASSQTDTALSAGTIGSFSTVSTDNILLKVFTSGEDAQSVDLTAAASGNTESSVYLGNSAMNEIGVALTSGTLTGSPSFGGSLVLSNQQTTTLGEYGGETFSGVGALTTFNSIGALIVPGDDGPSITLTDGAITVDGNAISSSATNNSAVGAAGAPGNEISLGVNLAGVTTGEDAINSISGAGELATGADLALSNQQLDDGFGPVSTTEYAGIYARVQNLAGSNVGVSGNTESSSALGNNASNAIDTASGAGINLISGFAALTSEQTGLVASNATTEYTGISIYAGNGEGSLSVTNSSLILSGDEITANAGVNLITNSVSLAASTIDAGPLGTVGAPAVVSGAINGTALADAGLSLNSQQNASSGGYAHVYEASVDVAAYLSGETLSNNSVAVTNPVIAATATGNSATNSIIADASQGVSGSAGLLNTQLMGGNGATAYLTEADDDAGSFAGITEQSYGLGGITGSSALLSGASMAAEATSNYASNTLDVTGGTLAGAAGGTVGLAAQLTSYAAGEALSGLALGNVQFADGSEADAVGFYTQEVVGVDSAGGTIANSSFTVSGPANNAPTSQALALGNEAVNMLTAAASTVMEDTAALVNAQNDLVGAAASLQYAYVYAYLNSDAISYPSVDGNDGGDVSDTSVVVGTGAVGGSNANILRALAYGNQASNELSASATSLAPSAIGLENYVVDGSVIPGGYGTFDTSLSVGSSFAVGAAFGLLNDQVSQGDVSSSVYDADIGAYIGNATTNPTVTDVTESTAGNAVVASVFGNQADNAGSISAGNLAVEAYTPLADVTNLQNNHAEINGSLTQEVNDDDDTFISEIAGTGQVTDSTIGVTNNSAITQVEGNDATSSLDTAGGNIVDASTVALPGLSGYTYGEGPATASDAFTVQNSQYDESTVSASQPVSDALVSIGGSVDTSTMTAEGNVFQATGYENNATNSLAFGGTSNPVDLLDTSSGVQSVQLTDGYVNATLGAPGTLASPGTPDTTIASVEFDVANGNNTGVLSNDGATLQVEGQPVIFDLSGLTSDERTEFEDLFSGGSTSINGTSFTLSAGTYTLASTDIFGTTDENVYHTTGGGVVDQPTGSITLNDGTPATPAVPPSPSVLITVGGNIQSSTLVVSDNAFDATAVVNNAVNTQSIAATTVNGGAGIEPGTAGGTVDDYESQASADYAVNNVQSTNSDASATGNAEAGINPDSTSTVTDSTLTVSNNTQLTKAEGDVASNTLSLAATDTSGTPPTAALTSYQYDVESASATNGTGDFEGEPDFLITAPGAIDGSTLTMDNNTSESLAVLNNVTNLVTASATMLDTADDELTNASAQYSGTAISLADYSLTNDQLAAGGTVTSYNTTEISNSDSNTVTTAGLVSSSVDISGNTTSAFAEVNSAQNTLDMSATSSTATGALLNRQSSADSVTAAGVAGAGFSLNGGEEDAAAADSAINVSDNSLQVQAIGNEATNALNADTGATYGTQTGAFSTPAAASATYAVLNSQSNAGNVSAASAAFYQSNLSGGGSEQPVLNSTVTVSYNVVSSKAFGNSADNSMTVAALNSGNATADLQNTQTNSGNVGAAVFGSQIGSNIQSPGVSNATVAVGNNSVVASAIGNVATNSIAH